MKCRWKDWVMMLALSTPFLIDAVPFSVPEGKYSKWSEEFPAEIIVGKQGDQPLITPFSFRSISDWVIDQNTESFDPDQVQIGDLIYVNVWYLDWFENTIHDRIPVPYILICCDVGGMVPRFGRHKKLLYDPKLAAWFGKNMAFSYHPKCFQIAMGQNDLLWTDFYTQGFKQYLLDRISEGFFEKKYILYMNHCPRKDFGRDKIVAIFESQPFCFSRNHSTVPYKGVSRIQYYDDLASSQFVISPIGLEVDCVRNWEAFLFGCVPVVEHTYLDPLYEGLPIVFVNDYQEVNAEFLERKWQELQSGSYRLDKAYFPYWENLIKNVQQKIRQDPTHYSNVDKTKFSQDELQDLKSIIDLTKSHRTGKKHLVCIGSLMGARPFQLSNTFSSLIRKVYTFDPWPGLVSDNDNLKQYTSYEDVLSTFSKKENLMVFLDLTYFRASLHLHIEKHPRHTLKEDLVWVYRRLKKNDVLCGNLRLDPYVKEVLQKFSEQNNIKIEEKNGFWYCKRR